ncbi:hypothetical protein VTJ04DRAFT_1956 [Mycothermus thermophilus]|uniref:uncharacterized protein n=1 Tax=Humicola insolens TaxID=85995 RepID=UPI0037435497
MDKINLLLIAPLPDTPSHLDAFRDINEMRLRTMATYAARCAVRLRLSVLSEEGVVIDELDPVDLATRPINTAAVVRADQGQTAAAAAPAAIIDTITHRKRLLSLLVHVSHSLNQLAVCAHRLANAIAAAANGFSLRLAEMINAVVGRVEGRVRVTCDRLALAAGFFKKKNT